LTAQSGSTVSPGNSIGTLTVNGNLTLAAGSLLAIEVSPSGSDMVTVTGTASLAGNLTITPSAGEYAFFQRFTLVSANTVTGTFANSSVGDFGAKFLPKLMYDATSVVLRLDPKSLVEVGGGSLRGNALAFATAFDTAVFAGYNPERFANLYAQGTNLAGALGQFTGERYSAERQAAMQSTHVVRDAAFAALNDDLVHAADTASESKYAGDTLTTVWMRAAGSWGTVKADGTGSRYKTDQTAVLTGIDVSTGGFKLGGMVSQSSTDVNLYSLGQSNIESVGATVYAGYRPDTSGFAVGFGAGFASNSALGSRAITVPTLAQVLIGKTKSTSLQYFAEASYDFAGAANTRIEPFARIARVELDSKAFTETGGSAALHGDKQSNSRTMAGAGIRGAHASANKTLSASLGWQRTSGDLSAPTNLRLSLIDTPYEVHSAALDRNAVTLDTQASFRLSSHMMFGIGYNALAGKNNRSHGARATIRYAF
jgi:outer membrane autotransporter protein